MAKYLDENGLLYFWQQIKTKFAGFAFSKVRITNGSTNTDLEADTISDMLTIVNGNDITLTPTANTDTVSISHSNSGVTAASKGDTTNQTPGFGGTFKVTSGTVNARGHLTAFADHTVTIPNATAVANSSSGATDGAAGLMSANDKRILDGLVSTGGEPNVIESISINGTAVTVTNKDAAIPAATDSVNGYMTATDHTKLTGIATGAEVNQNAFSNVKVGSSTVAADSKTDTLELVAGNNVTLSADTTNDTITINAAAPDNTFIATYNTTTYSEVTTALTAGKSVIVKDSRSGKDGFYLYKKTATNGTYLFEGAGPDGLQITTLSLLSNDTWTGNSTNLASTSSVSGKQDKITATGPLVGDGDGGVTAAVSGTDLKTVNNTSIIGSGNVSVGTVTSIRVQATSPVQSSTSTEQSTSLNTTISLADGYGDTKNPYAAKNPHYVLAGPSSGSSAAVPSFRALVADDIPSITVSKISDFPDLANIYKYKGSVAAYADLPSTGLTAGDVYDVQSDGMNYAWTGTAWDALGMSFSITSISNAEIDAILAQ